VLDGTDGADFRVAAAKLALRVQEGVDMKSRCCGPAAKLSQTEDELLLQVVGQVILRAEEDDAAL
jgi:hypothetical protein